MVGGVKMAEPKKPDIQPDFLNSLFGLGTKSKKKRNLVWESDLPECEIGEFQIVPLTTSRHLRAEGRMMRHCAGTYDDQVIFLFCHTLSPEYLFYWMDYRKSTYAAATASFDCRRYFSIRADQTKGSWLGMPSTCEP